MVFFFFFWPHHAECGILGLARIEPKPCFGEHGVFTTGPPGKSLSDFFF